MRRLRERSLWPIIFSLSVLALALTVACPPPSLVTPEGKAAYVADQVVLRVEALQGAAIMANATMQPGTTTPALTTDQTRKVVQFCVTAETMLKEVKSGWEPRLIQAYTVWKAGLDAPTQAKLSSYLLALDTAMVALQQDFGGTP